jgi:hypothetical protein
MMSAGLCNRIKIIRDLPRDEPKLIGTRLWSRSIYVTTACVVGILDSSQVHVSCSLDLFARAFEISDC